MATRFDKPLAAAALSTLMLLGVSIRPLATTTQAAEVARKDAVEEVSTHKGNAEQVLARRAVCRVMDEAEWFLITGQHSAYGGTYCAR
jgi:hypothetical protein